MIARADKPFVSPALEWEKVGNVPNVIFLEGAVSTMPPNAGTLELLGYYGGADKYIGGMRIHISLDHK